MVSGDGASSGVHPRGGGGGGGGIKEPGPGCARLPASLLV